MNGHVLPVAWMFIANVCLSGHYYECLQAAGDWRKKATMHGRMPSTFCVLRCGEKPLHDKKR
jgi:hypothetical protein